MKKTFIAILLLAIVVAQNSILDKHIKEQNFLNYSKRHNKRYSSLEESLYRFSIYKDNLKTIEQLNKEVPSATFAENKFVDMTPEEFQAKYGGLKLPDEAKQKNRKLEVESYDRNLATYPPSIDLRGKAGIQPIKDQGACGSCWAFATVSALEYAYWKKTGYAGDLSEQHLVDCTHQYGGCGGGWTYLVYEYIQKLPGIAWEWDYKYTATEGTCRAEALKSRMSVWLNQKKAYETIAPNDDAHRSAIANVGVIDVCVDANGWTYYKSGIFVDPSYNDQSKRLYCNHAVTMVGYGTENGIPYYIIRNSWGTSWGENGYIKVDARKHPNGNSYSGLDLQFSHYPIIY